MELTQTSECKWNDDFTAWIDETAQAVFAAYAAESFEEISRCRILWFDHDIAVLVDVTGEIISTILLWNSNRIQHVRVGQRL